MSERPPLVAGADAAVVAGKLGRPPHAMSAVATRCPFGFPAVVEDLPFDERRPAVSRRCTTAPVRRWSPPSPAWRATAAWPRGRGRVAGLSLSWRARRRTRRRRLRRAPHRPDARPRAHHGRRRRVARRAGVGGVSDLLAVKCLHAHVAHALAQPGYVLGEAILGAGHQTWCDDCRCAGPAPRTPGRGTRREGRRWSTWAPTPAGCSWPRRRPPATCGRDARDDRGRASGPGRGQDRPAARGRRGEDPRLPRGATRRASSGGARDEAC